MTGELDKKTSNDESKFTEDVLKSKSNNLTASKKHSKNKKNYMTIQNYPIVFQSEK